jgi:hypothetical protein
MSGAVGFAAFLTFPPRFLDALGRRRAQGTGQFKMMVTVGMFSSRFDKP